jgi:hypothetical protein
MKLLGRVVWSLGGLAFASASHAFVDTPRFEPAQPREGQPIFLVVRAGLCDAFVETAQGPQLLVTGRSIRLVVAGVHESDVHCIFDPDGVDYRFPIGSYAAGDLTVALLMQPFGDPESEPLLLSTQSVAVLPRGAPHAIPGSSQWAVGVLFASLASIALAHFRRARRG